MDLDKYKYITHINSPEDLKKYKINELDLICNEIRDYIIECCAKNPGHLGSSIGAVEIITALHYVYNSPFDKIVFDVGHQAYAHKILTGRRDIFQLNRKKEGISGFPKMSESEHDAFGTGHASTAISAALGMAKAAELQASNRNIVALIGDGAMTGGMAMEAMNNASNSNILVILNDNNQSIDSNIGALHDYLLKISTHPKYNSIKSKIWDKIGEGKIRKFLQKITKQAKSNLVSTSGGDFFEAFGFRYFGPIDGHNTTKLVETLNNIKNIKGAKLLHIKTIKGKGLDIAEKQPTIWHAPGKFDPNTGERSSKPETSYKYQDVFGEVLLDLATKDDKIIGITPAMSTGCGMNKLADSLPERFFDVGIAEEHAVTFSAGLSASGMKPVCNIYSSFSQRAYDQIIHDVALQKLPVTFCFDRGGLVGEDGATHQGCYDLSAYRSIPNICIAAPRNEIELKNMLYTALKKQDTASIIRYPRGNAEGLNWKKEDYKLIEVGKAEKIKEGKNIAIICLGPEGNRAIEACTLFEKEYLWSPSVYDFRYLKPIDKECLNTIADQYKYIISIEEASLKGGLYGEVCEYMASIHYNGNIYGIGIPDEFIEQDSQEAQRKYCGLDTNNIYLKIKDLAIKLKK